MFSQGRYHRINKIASTNKMDAPKDDNLVVTKNVKNYLKEKNRFNLTFIYLHYFFFAFFN